MPSLKEQVLQMVSSIEDSQLLQLVKADIEYFGDKTTDILDELYYADKEEVLSLANEPDEKDTITEEEFKEVTARWRTK
ncbi:MAG TPA: hypothetical protein PLP23_22640 [Panacibacter sp.]|nr:hypothetical protein [Panacibacter sp.]